MASTYQEMKDGLQLLIDRADASDQIAPTSATTYDVLDQFYNRAERRFYRDDVSKIPPFEKVVSYTNVTAGTNALAIPSDYFELRWGEAAAGDRRVILDRVSPEQLRDNFISNRVTLPTRIAYGNNQFLVDPSNQMYDAVINYYGSLEPISSVVSGDTNHWIVNRADDLLLYWAAVEAGLYFDSIDKELISSWEGKATDIRDAIIRQETRQRESGSNLKWGSGPTFPNRYSYRTGY